jgi:hypothetical protein
MSVIGFFNEFNRRAERIRQRYGNKGLIKALFLLLLYPFYKHTRYFLYENIVKPEYEIDEPLPLIDISKLSFKVITTNQDARRLESEGYNFRRHPTPFNNYLKVYSKWLDYGVIAFCTFVDKEFAAICWIIPSREIQTKVKAPPLNIDYDNHEVLPRGAWVDPKFRSLEIYRFNTHNRDKYLVSKGITTLRSTIDITNSPGKGLVEALGQKQYGKSIALRILCFSSWKETYDK